MVQPYSSWDFFRRMPNALLARYFQGKGLFGELDFGAMKQTRPDALVAAWAALPDERCDALEAELSAVHTLSDAAGWQALQDAARDMLEADAAADFVAALAALEDHHAQAMTAFLDQPTLWPWAERYHHAGRLAYWKKLHNLARVDVVPDVESACEALSAAIRDHFIHAEGRGRNCHVEHSRRGAKDYFFAFPRDHATQALEWVSDDMTRRPHSPVFELVFLYERGAGQLDLYCRDAPRSVRALQEIFARTVLRQEDFSANSKDGRTYDLSRLTDANFQFARGLDSRIGDVQIKKLRLSRRWRKGEHITSHCRQAAPLHCTTCWQACGRRGC